MYQFVCDRLVPGCTATETADTKEAAHDKAKNHIRKHHPNFERLLAEEDQEFDQLIRDGLIMLPR